MTLRPRKDLIQYSLASKAAPVLSCRCHLSSTLDLIKSLLNAPKYDEFRRCCFGRFIDTPKVEFKAILCHLIMIHMCTENRGSIFFKIRNQLVEFGPKEFYLCSGLKFGPAKPLPRHSDLHSRYFGGRKTVTVDDIHRALKRASHRNKGSDDTLKLALLYFLFVVIHGQDQQRSVGSQFIHLADDLSAFNSYPWGHVAYTFLVESLFSAYDKMRDLAVKRQNMKYDLYGFSHIFLCWVYECFPAIGSMCSSIPQGHEALIPRIVRRTCLSRKSWADLKALFQEGGDFLTYRSMILSSDEAAALDLELPYFPAVADPQASTSNGGTPVDCTNCRRQNSRDEDGAAERQQSVSDPQRPPMIIDDNADHTEASSYSNGCIPNPTGSRKKISSDYAEFLVEARCTLSTILTRMVEFATLLQLPTSGNFECSRQQMQGPATTEEINELAGVVLDALSDAEDQLFGQSPSHTRHRSSSIQPEVGHPCRSGPSMDSGFSLAARVSKHDTIADITESAQVNELDKSFNADGGLHAAPTAAFGQSEQVKEAYTPSNEAGLGDVARTEDAVEGSEQVKEGDTPSNEEGGSDVGVAPVVVQNEQVKDSDTGCYDEGGSDAAKAVVAENEEVDGSDTPSNEGGSDVGSVVVFGQIQQVKEMDTPCNDEVVGDVTTAEDDVDMSSKRRKRQRPTNAAKEKTAQDLVHAVPRGKKRQRKRRSGRKQVREDAVERRPTLLPPATGAFVDLTGCPSLDVDDGDGISGRLVRRKSVNGVAIRSSSRTTAAPRFKWTCQGVTVTEQEKSGFHIWHGVAVRHFNDGALKLPLEQFPIVGVGILTSLLNPIKDLSNTQLDILLNLLLYKGRLTPSDYRSKPWSVLEYQGSYKLLSPYTQRQDAVFKNYAIGRWPIERGIAWNKIEKVYGIALARQNHWVAYAIHFLEETVYVYDPMYSPAGVEEIIQNFKPALSLLPNLAMHHGFLEGRTPLNCLHATWKINVLEGTPQQANTHDCGLISFKIIECLAQGTPLESINGRSSASLRDDLCHDIFRFHRPAS